VELSLKLIENINDSRFYVIFINYPSIVHTEVLSHALILAPNISIRPLQFSQLFCRMKKNQGGLHEK